jgi:putative acetyltransferase
VSVAVRLLRADEGRTYLEIVNSAIRGFAVTHYSAEAIGGWTVPITDESLRDLALNVDHEIRLVAELDGSVVGIGAVVLERSELRACYVSPHAARRFIQPTAIAFVSEVRSLYATAIRWQRCG